MYSLPNQCCLRLDQTGNSKAPFPEKRLAHSFLPEMKSKDNGGCVRTVRQVKRNHTALPETPSSHWLLCYHSLLLYTKPSLPSRFFLVFCVSFASNVWGTQHYPCNNADLWVFTAQSQVFMIIFLSSSLPKKRTRLDECQVTKRHEYQVGMSDTGEVNYWT